MTRSLFDIRHGKLIDVVGSPVRFESVTFVPATVELFGNGFSAQFNFADWCRDHAIKLPSIVRGEENAAWLLGRLMTLFNIGNVPEDERTEKSCFHLSFVAVLHESSNVAVPFDCLDHYGRTALMFSSEDEPPIESRSEIADSFYKLMLDDPEAITDYDDQLLHSGAGVWIDFGVSHGEPYFDVRSETDD